MKVLLTGAGGQLGTAIARALPAGIELARYNRGELDVSDAEAVHKAIKSAEPAVVINAAAYNAVDRAEDDRDAAFQVNAGGPGLLAQACHDVGARLVHFSTDYVFAGTRPHALTPEDEPSPLGVYGQSKLAGERAVLAQAGNLVIRTAWLYAAHRPNFMQTMLRLMREREDIGVVADQIGTPTHAASLASATWALISLGAGGIQHFTDAGAASWYDFAVAIQEEALAVGLLARPCRIRPLRTQDYPARASRPAFGLLDKTRTWELLGGPARHWRAELRLALAEQMGSAHG